MLVQAGDIYEHFKGHRYQVLMVGILTGDLADQTGGERAMVIYSPLVEEGVYVRSVTDFLDTVERGEYKGPRFEKVKE